LLLWIRSSLLLVKLRLTNAPSGRRSLAPRELERLGFRKTCVCVYVLCLDEVLILISRQYLEWIGGFVQEVIAVSLEIF
jgi:hypothetical protein